MRKNMAGPLEDFRIETIPCMPAWTCPQFLWINLCGIAFPQGKSLIFIRDISPMKILAAWQGVLAAPVQLASSHFLWTKLCASVPSSTKPVDL
jgi:hypothetical protein